MKIPSNKIWTQLNEGEVSGILNDTKNIALDTVGQAKLSKRAVALKSDITSGTFGYPVAIAYFDSKYTVVTDDKVWQGDMDGTTFTVESDFEPSATLGSDALVFNNRLVVTEDSNIADWDGAGDDVYSLESLTSGVPHPLCIFDSQTTYKLAVGNGNTVKLLDTTYVPSATVLTLASQFVVTTMRYRNGYLYVGTKTTDGSEARIFIWNGSGASAQYECPVGCEWVFSMTEFGTSVAAIVSSGQIGQVSGSSFLPLAALPVFYEPHARWQGAGGLLLNGKVFNRGMITVGNTIYMNIEGETDTGFIPEMKSGIWVYDPDVGLYHRATSTTDLLVRDSTFTVANDIITTSATHNLKTGDTVQFTGVSGITGIANNVQYHVTVLSSTTLKLSLTRESVASERYVSLSGTVTTDRLIYFPNTDRGLSLTATSGAITQTTVNETPLDMLSSEVIWGCRTSDEAGTNTYVLNAFHDSNNTGSFTTQRVYTDNIEQTWNAIYPFLDGLVTEEDKAIVKAQTKHQATRLELDGVWLSENQINSTGTTLTTAWGDIEEGDELVFIDGKGQGRSAHVTAIEASTSTYSLTLDEDIGTANDTVSFYRTNFKKIGEYGVDEKENEFIKSAIQENKHSPWIKIKCELRGTNLAVNILELTNEKHK